MLVDFSRSETETHRSCSQNGVAEPKRAGALRALSFIRGKGKGRAGGGPGVSGQSDTAPESECLSVLAALGTKGIQSTWQVLARPGTSRGGGRAAPSSRQQQVTGYGYH